MKPEAVLAIAGGLLQVPVILEVKNLGYKAIVSDQNPKGSACLLGDEVHAIDIYDVDAHLMLVDKLQKECNLKAVFTAAADCEVTVAACAERAGLPGIPVHVAMRCKNKAKMRACVGGISWWKEIQAITHDLYTEYPLVVKPADNSASRGVQVVRNVACLAKALKGALANSSTGTAVLEPFLRGSEHTVEIVFHAGIWDRLNICDRFFCPEYLPYCIECGHINPTSLMEEAQHRLYEFCANTAKRIGVDQGVFKCDIMITENNRIVLLECTARLSGGFDSGWTQPLALGTNPTRVALMAALGQKVQFKDLVPSKSQHSAAMSWLPPVGTKTRITQNLLQEVKKITGVMEAFSRLPMDTDCTLGNYQSGADRPLFIISKASSRKEAMDICYNAETYLSKKSILPDADGCS